MDRGARAQERARQVFRRVQAMVRRPRKIVRRFQRALGGVYVQAELVLERQAADARKIARAAQLVEQFEQRVFALAFDHEIDVLGVERSLGVERCEVAAPHDGHARVLLAERAAHGNRLEQLRTRHHGDAEQFHAVAPHQRVDGRPRIGVGIAVHDFVLFAALEHRAQIENGKRQAAILRLGAARMEQDDHAVNLPARIQKLEGGRLPRQRAFHGRSAHCQPYQGR